MRSGCTHGQTESNCRRKWRKIGNVDALGMLCSLVMIWSGCTWIIWTSGVLCSSVINKRRLYFCLVLLWSPSFKRSKYTSGKMQEINSVTILMKTTKKPLHILYVSPKLSGVKWVKTECTNCWLRKICYWANMRRFTSCWYYTVWTRVFWEIHHLYFSYELHPGNGEPKPGHKSHYMSLVSNSMNCFDEFRYVLFVNVSL